MFLENEMTCGRVRGVRRVLLALFLFAVTLSACSNYSAPMGGYSYILTVQSGGFGVTTPSGMETATSGAAYAITATPSSGYSFCDWKVKSGTATFGKAATSASNTVTVTGGNATIQANFIVNTAPACTS